MKDNRSELVSHLTCKSGVYSLYRDGNVFYIGISSNLKSRILSHMTRYGINMEFDILEYFECEKYLTKDQLKRETYWINEYISKGCKLINRNIVNKRTPQIINLNS